MLILSVFLLQNRWVNQRLAVGALPQSKSEGENAMLKVFKFCLLLMLEATLESVDCSIDAAILA